MQIRTRLTFQFSLIVAFLLLLTMVLIYTLSKEQLKREFYKGLESKVLMTAEMVAKYNSLKPEDYLSKIDEKPDIVLPTKEKISIYTLQQEKVYAFQRGDDIPSNILNEISALKNKETVKFNLKDFEGIGIKYKNNLNEEYLLVSQGVFASEELSRLSYILIIVFLIVIFLVGLGGYIFSVQALSPVAHIIRQMDEVFPSQIGKRLNPGRNNDEITRLAEMFNGLLEKAEEAFLNQKGFLSNISHELKNPLASAIAQLEVTLHMERSQKEYAQVMQSLLIDMRELKNVVEQLMALARITSGDKKASFEAVRLDELIWQVQANLKKIHGEYTIKVDTSNMPENPDFMLIHGNELLLKTAISNLCENACKFSPDHTAYIRFNLSESNEPVLEIEDNGNAIPQEEQSLIFKSFYRSPGTSHIKGTGIGLPLVQHILKMHQAHIGLTSGLNIGNKFTIWFKNLTQDNFSKLKEAS
jgi:signal transduction histidine kinase